MTTTSPHTEQPTPPPGPPPGASTAPLRVLLVEDNAVNQMLATAILKKGGHRVDLANDGVEAVDAVRSKPYDVVLMDVQMPNMDGLEATRRIRQLDNPDRAKVHIIAMTANALLGDRETCLSAGMDEYLPKPIDQKRLRAALEQARLHAPGDAAEPSTDEDDVVVLDVARVRQLEETVGSDEIATMVSMAIAQVPPAMALIQAANAAGDLEKMREEAHDIGSNFGNFGAVKLHGHILELEQACRDGRAARASLLCNQLSDLLDEAVRALKDHIGTSASKVA